MATARASIAQVIVDDLQRVFGRRLETVVAYGFLPGSPVPTLALVESLTADDLADCASRTQGWRRQGLATPLLITRDEFVRSLDAFPIEYGEIIDRHDVLFGSDPFLGLSIPAADLRRACEVQVKSHLLHLREDFLESGERRAEVDALVRESAPGFAAVLRQLARLDGMATESLPQLAEYATRRAGLEARVTGDLLALAHGADSTAVDAARLFPEYLATMERLAAFVDRWREA